MHFDTAIVLISFTLQCVAVAYAFRLITITGHTTAWVLLSAGIATMAARRFITLLTMLTNPGSHRALDLPYELIGVAGSAMMLAGVVMIKPLFIALRSAEESQRALAVGLQEAMNNIKVLKTMLPICANCKKIRDDSGYWQSVEGYISAHSDTKFSHGICPDCIQKLYPEICDEVLAKCPTPQ